MEIKYQVYFDDWSKCVNFVDVDKVVDLPLVDIKERYPRKAKVKIVSQQEKGTEPIEILGSFGQPYGAGQYFVSIAEFYPEEEE